MKCSVSNFLKKYDALGTCPRRPVKTRRLKRMSSGRQSRDVNRPSWGLPGDVLCPLGRFVKIYANCKYSFFCQLKCKFIT